MKKLLAKILLILACCFAACSAPIFAQTEIPRFKDYPVAEKFNGPTARLIWKGEARMYRTRIREAAREQPNFAGHYIVASWGCGESIFAAIHNLLLGISIQQNFLTKLPTH